MKLKRQPFRDPTFKPDGPGIFLPIRTSTQGNNRRHWRIVAMEAKKQRSMAELAVISAIRTGKIPRQFGDGLTVQFTRYSSGKLDGFGNVDSAMKHLCDGVCDVYHVDDADPRWTFLPTKQVKTARGRVGVTICITKTLPSNPHGVSK